MTVASSVLNLHSPKNEKFKKKFLTSGVLKIVLTYTN